MLNTLHLFCLYLGFRFGCSILQGCGEQITNCNSLTYNYYFIYCILFLGTLGVCHFLRVFEWWFSFVFIPFTFFYYAVPFSWTKCPLVGSWSSKIVYWNELWWLDTVQRFGHHYGNGVGLKGDLTMEYHKIWTQTIQPLTIVNEQCSRKNASLTTSLEECITNTWRWEVFKRILMKSLLGVQAPKFKS